MNQREIRRYGNTRIRTITLRDDQFAALEVLAEENGDGNMSAVIREAVDEHVARRKRDSSAPHLAEKLAANTASAAHG